MTDLKELAYFCSTFIYFKGGPYTLKEADEGVLSNMPALPY